MTRTLALVDVDGKISMLDLMNHFRLGVACKSKAEIWVTKGLLDEAKEYVLGMEIFRTRSGNTLRVSRFRFSNMMSVQILLGGHSTQSLVGVLSKNHDEEKNSKGSCIYALRSHVYQIVCTRPDIAPVDVGFEIRLVAGIATCALTKVVLSPRFQHWLKLVRIGEG
uniref:Zinc finger, CCHC-type n=1 Tax=Tanacetum cinerariifolium TaxID=118510 RepID=A0A699HHA2_TANCI|nr:zinc finger, CCHC-type [Tanacetum cinerariifolium]